MNNNGLLPFFLVTSDFFHDRLKDLPFSKRDIYFSQFFLQIKGQNTLLLSILSGLNELKVSHPECLELIDKSLVLINTLLNCTYDQLERQAKATPEEIGNILSEAYSNNSVEKLLNSALRVSMHISALISDFGTVIDNEHEDESSRQDFGDLNISDSANTIICRICNQEVPLNLVEEHTNFCIARYEIENKIAENNEEMRQLHDLLISEVKHAWPGEETEIINVVLPRLMLCSILNHVILDNPQIIDTRMCLEYTLVLLQNMELFADNKVNEYCSEVKRLLVKQVQRCRYIKYAQDILRITTFKNSGEKLPTTQVSLSDFELLKKISSGAYARVFLVKKKITSDIYAMKVLHKDDLRQKNQLQRILLEKDILFQFSSEYLVNFYYSIIGHRNLYIIMEYLPGGDLFSLLQMVGALDEESARIYTKQVVMALSYLHKNGVIHRDLKPDNILITANGTLKLIDFGLSFMGVNNRSEQTIVGTPDYVAPEIVMKQPHTFTSDYWSLGSLVYELLSGVPPFNSSSEKYTFQKIIRCKYEPLTDDICSKEAQDFVSKLLQINPDERLGANGAEEVLSHPWLADIDLETCEVPFIPDTSDITSTDYFIDRHNMNFDDDDINKDILETEVQPSLYSSAGTNSEVSIPDDEDSDLAGFPAVHVSQLGNQNLVASEIVRARARSFAFEAPLTNSTSFQGIVPKVSGVSSLRTGSLSKVDSQKLSSLGFSSEVSNQLMKRSSFSSNASYDDSFLPKKS